MKRFISFLFLLFTPAIAWFFNIKFICLLRHFFERQVFLIIALPLLFFNCSEPISVKANWKGLTGHIQSIGATADSVPSFLSLGKYIEWLEEQKGMAYDEQENDQLRLTLLYKPLVLEAALSGGGISETELQKYILLKKGYHYLSIKCLDKNMSLSRSVSKEAVLRQIQEGIYVVQNRSDTIKNCILEIFPASVMNQPHELLMLVPFDSSYSQLSVGVRGKAFALPDLHIHISQKQIQSFPEVKI